MKKTRMILQTISMTALLIVMISSFGNRVSGQFTFMGDYDKTFAPPLGYYVDPEDPYPGSNDEYQTYFNSGELLPDGSIVAGGGFTDSTVRVSFYIKKFTPTGALDTSFGTGGYVRTKFHLRYDGVPATDTPQVLKVQPDGKILVAGKCRTLEPAADSAAFGVDACVIRYNANGTLDSSFGGATLVYTGQSTTQTYATQLDPGKVMIQTGLISNGQSFGTQGTFYDMAIQPDGKIVLVGEARYFANFFAVQGYGAIVVRLNANGSLDSTFGTNGIARWTAPEASAGCFPTRSFHGMRLQPDGRILAVGTDHIVNANCQQYPRFVVTRWTANGQLETVRHLDNDTTTIGRQEGAGSVLFTRDGTKILVSGSYKNLGGASPPNLLTMVRFNLSDLSVDTTFGNGGIRQHLSGCGSVACGGFSGGRLQVKAIQPDGKILAIDGAGSGGNIVRYNPDGTLDQSFGNGINGAGGLLGRLKVNVLNYNNFSAPLEASQILVRPNGRINLLGYSAAHSGLGILRAVVSQQNTVFENGIYSDFTNDGKSEISVFRDGNWYYLNSANNQFSGLQFGQAGDKPVPADYDGDGKTDVAVFRGGFWYILQSSNNQFRGLQFGQAGDLPLPGDFDGDGLADISVFRPSNGGWYRLNSSNNQFVGLQFGQNSDVPLLADFDGDGRSDIAVYRGGFWYYLQSSDGGFRGLQFGASTDIPVVGDYDGDSKSDIAVFRPSNGSWYYLRSSDSGFFGAAFGQNGDKPVPGDYDNDGKNDLAVFRNGNWYILRSSDNQFTGVGFGFGTDIPIPSVYLP